MCLRARPAWATGRGDALSDEPRLPPLHAVLVNPGLPSPTGAVYRAYDEAPEGGADQPDAPADWSPAAVIDWLKGQRNDLEAPALRVTPGIGEALAAMRAAPGCRLTRMSGSGATVFGLFDDAAGGRGGGGRAAAPRLVGAGLRAGRNPLTLPSSRPSGAAAPSRDRPRRRRFLRSRISAARFPG